MTRIALSEPQRNNDFDKTLESLVTAVASGDERAFRNLYDRTVGAVYNLALRITGRSDLAEDTMPDVYMQVWRTAETFDVQRGRVLTWLLVICRTRALDLLRQQERSEPFVETDFVDIESLTRHPEELMLYVERDAILHATLAALGPMHRQLIALAFMRGLSHHEIAAWVGMPLGSVKTHLRKALEILKKDLARERGILTFNEA